ncbi:aaa-family atpase [Holotrichia oblita]|uniref:Aaa-family atpase n=1 Tax=Holotrichia oblita TaxID=644536 RepID=A0ACB9TDB4_HOLOL|nr:aaa-family atpase [Holotrichia oblita]
MFQRTLRVKYITSKNCFCYLSDKYSKTFQESSVAKVDFEDKTYFFSLGGHLISLKDDEIGINGTYAYELGLEEDESVNLVKYDGISNVLSLDIYPCLKDDIIILESNAESIQDTLLNQIRIVNNNQKAVIWVSNTIHVAVNIDGVKPSTPGRLEFLTAVTIKAAIPKNKEKKIQSKENITNWVYYNKSLSTMTNTNLSTYENNNELLVCRAFSLKSVKNFVSKHFIFNVYAPKKLLPLKVVQNSSNHFSITPIHFVTEYEDNSNLKRDAVVRLFPLEESDYELPTSHFVPLFMDDAILKTLKLSIGAKIILDHEISSGDITKVEILTNTHRLDEEITQQFKQMVAENSVNDKILLNSDIPICLPNSDKITLKFSPECVSATFLDSNFIRNNQIMIKKIETSDEPDFQLEKKMDNICLSMANLENIFNRCTNSFKLGLKTATKFEHVLVVGKHGTGKTTIVKYFAEKLSMAPYYVHVETVKCKNIKGKSLDSLYKLFTNTFLKVIYYQPSVLIIDDIHMVCEKVLEEDPATREMVSLISEMLVDLFEHYLNNNYIMLAATAESTFKLNHHVFMSRGNHIFKNIFSIDELNKKDREIFLKYIFSRCGDISNTIDFDVLSLKTEGYVVQDLVDFIDKCVFESYKEDSQEVNMNHCLRAIDHSSSLSLKNVNLYSHGDRSFSDVGGLDDVKKILIESMMWPVQYTNIFGSSPLRLQSGLLLYGPPGTGKTILAGAAAKQCGLRLISIKGPELLSKYIGASEQAVRDVFEKAQAAKPCILFFDEFDSLAPRRGHDSTGVTDRVVNQFLTQLDGIESLTGVCVLAATSRPDLLDPALLRPGRLDQQLLCPLPNKEERLSILKVLSKSLGLYKDVNLEYIAEATEGYTGADLQSILYTAQLTSMEYVLSETETELAERETERVLVNQHQLIEALNSTRPSLTKEDRLKYERM